MVSLTAVADDGGSESPEFLLGEIGVQLNLDKRSWKMDRWSDWDFKATSKDKVLIYAWSTPFQMEVTEADLDGWVKVHQEKATEEGSSETTVKSQALIDVSGQKAAFVQLEMATAQGTKLVMDGMTFPVRGKMFHLATVASFANARSSRKSLDQAISTLDIKTKARDLKWGGEVSSDTSSATLSEFWRKPLNSEMMAVAKMAKSLTVPTLMGCWTAVRPVAGTKPDIMITCQDEKVLGIVDEYTFPDVEAKLKAAWFGSNADVEAQTIQVDDGRVGVLFASVVAGQEIHIVGVPNGNGLAKTIVTGAGKSGLKLGDEAHQMAKSTVVAPPPPLAFRDTALYYLSYRPFHPYVLGPILLGLIVFCLIIAMIVIGARRQPTYDY
jgi:hypothetical protein